jgi:hypothetical protein
MSGSGRPIGHAAPDEGVANVKHFTGISGKQSVPSAPPWVFLISSGEYLATPNRKNAILLVRSSATHFVGGNVMSGRNIKIVVSYRRDDARGTAGRIYDRLEQHYGRESVFMDVDSIPFGVDFHDHIQEVLSGCSALLAVIGPHWIGQRRGKPPRIKEETDFVRMEVEAAQLT